MKKTAIVTGSSRGIGFAIAKQLGLDGYNIVMVATGPQEKNQAALDELKTQDIDCARFWTAHWPPLAAWMCWLIMQALLPKSAPICWI